MAELTPPAQKAQTIQKQPRTECGDRSAESPRHTYYVDYIDGRGMFGYNGSTLYLYPLY